MGSEHQFNAANDGLPGKNGMAKGSAGPYTAQSVSVSSTLVSLVTFRVRNVDERMDGRLINLCASPADY